MTTEIAQTLKNRGFAVPALELPGSLIDDLNTGEPAYKLSPKSSPLAWRVAFYAVGRDLAWDEADANRLPEPVRKAGRIIYDEAQKKGHRGGWHKDGVLFLPRSQTPKGMRQPQSDDYALAQYFIDIHGFNETQNGWEIVPSDDTPEPVYVWIPKGGGRFYVPTPDGPWHPVTGTPRETVKSRDEAIRRWKDAGLTEEQAESELSRFHATPDGVRAVHSWSGGGNGPLGVYLDYVPDDGLSWRSFFDLVGSLGSFPASRQASRASRADRSQLTAAVDEMESALSRLRSAIQ